MFRARVRTLLIILLISLTMVPGVMAQNEGGIRGAVTDNEFDVPLGSATVQIVETGDRTETGAEGQFVFQNVLPGSYTLIITKDGYTRSVVSNVVVSPGNMASVSTGLSGEYTDMAALTVRPLTLGNDTEIDLLNLKVEFVGIMDGIGADLMSKTAAGSAAEAVQLVSGASVQDGKYAVIRGLSDRFVNTRMNGLALPTADPDVRAVQLDLFPSALLESVRVYKTFTPDLPANTSGGSINIITSGIPDGPLLEASLGLSGNSFATFNDDFITYDGGGVDYFGIDEGQRKKVLEAGDVEIAQHSPRGYSPWVKEPTEEEEERWSLLDAQTRMFSDTIGTSRTKAPIGHSWGWATGDRYELTDELDAGWLTTATYSNSFSYFDDGKDHFRVGASDLDGYIIPIESGEVTTDPDQYDKAQGTETVRWGASALAGFELGEHSLTLFYLHTHHTEDKATILWDDHTNPKSYWLNQSLVYTERTLDSLQVQGEHPLSFIPVGGFGPFQWKTPKFTWSVATGRAVQDQPDRRFFLAEYEPETGTWSGPRTPEYGWAQRSWRKIIEESKVFDANLSLPFTVSDNDGEFKFGWSLNDTTRDYEQDTFYYQKPWGDGSMAISNTGTYESGSFEELWTDVFLDPERLGYPEPYGVGDEFSKEYNGVDWQANEHNWVISGSTEDIDYEGTMKINAAYAMVEYPVFSWLTVTGGARMETTEMKTDVSASDGNDDAAKVLNVRENPNRPMLQAAKDIDDVTLGDLANADIDETNVLPSLGITVEPIENLKIRAVWSQTIGRPTFKEITPVAQQDYLGSEKFAGNPDLKISTMKNYDLRMEWTPIPGSNYSIGGFYKDITDPIEYSMRPSPISMPYTIPFNYRTGEVLGAEVEIREKLDIIPKSFEDTRGEKWTRWLEDVTLGCNFTWLHATVELPETDVEELQNWIRTAGKDPDDFDVEERPMKNQPEYIVNVYLIYDNDRTGSSVGLYWNRKGETLVAGEDGNGDDYIANLVEKPYDTVNLSISQKLWWDLKLSLKFENILDPDIEEVWSSEYIPKDELATTYSKGVSCSISLSWEL